MSALRVGLDLDGSLESLSNTMSDLAGALARRTDLELVRFRTLTPPRGGDEVKMRGRRLFAPLWRHSWGPAIDQLIGAIDVVHVAGVATPPTSGAPLLISVDDLRPLRGRSGNSQRVVQLQRSVRRGAILVASSHAARHEVQESLRLERSDIVVAKPVVGHIAPTVNGANLVVSVAGGARQLDDLGPGLASFAARHHCELVVICSTAVAQEVRSSGVAAKVLSRRETGAALANARVAVSLSDGARFPSFAVAALSARVPVVARDNETAREVLTGAAELIETGTELFDVVESLWSDVSRRAILQAAGLSRAADFEPRNVASAYAALYHSVAARVSR